MMPDTHQNDLMATHIRLNRFFKRMTKGKDCPVNGPSNGSPLLR